MIHIVFQEADIQVLQQAIELDDSLQGRIEIVRDDYAVGPIHDIMETEGYQARRDWWKVQIEGSPYNADQMMGLVDDRLLLHNLKKELEENAKEEVWIWMGQNQHDVCGYYWLISQLAAFQGRISVLYMNNLPFINEKGNIFYPTALHEILPKEFLKAKKLSRKVTLSEFEIDPDEWRRLCAENAMIRILEGGKKIAGKEESFYDKDILNGLGKDWQKGHRAMTSILGKMKIKTGDIFLLNRLKKLVEEGKVELTGDPTKGWKEFEVRLKSAAPEIAAEAATS
ncbi:MAG TPA: DUF1835 domain-containing protein [Flavisolibacter sp.]|nr:DUF1835 domain-containing protein [Flavisolibacter sp.]